MTRDANDSHGAAHFQRLYDANPDPWSFRTSAYEQEKYERTVEVLRGRRFRSGFEAGCSIGVLTRRLAERCDTLLAVDIVEAPLETARTACADQPWVRFACMDIATNWPGEQFDLIVLSEVLYFLSPEAIACVAGWVRLFLAASRLAVTLAIRRPRYRIDVVT
jgi:2-polyprenyl-3-methyl-5-hydroxy-6-metoxy-1,4-benzoquinol methylase